jgi:hypothetical protein
MRGVMLWHRNRIRALECAVSAHGLNSNRPTNPPLRTADATARHALPGVFPFMPSSEIAELESSRILQTPSLIYCLASDV